MQGNEVLVERIGGVALITLNRPKARNAMNLALAGQLCAAVEAAQDAGAIVVTGADPAFCAGLDLRDLGVERLSDLPRAAAAVAASAVPVIAAVNGPAVTGGFEVALACDFIVASDRASFADTHLHVGVYPGPVLVDLPRRIGMAWAKEMSLTGDFVDAATALRIGLVNHVVPHDELVPLTLEVAQGIAQHDRGMVVTMRADWAATETLPLADAPSHPRRHGPRDRLPRSIRCRHRRPPRPRHRPRPPPTAHLNATGRSPEQSARGDGADGFAHGDERVLVDG